MESRTPGPASHSSAAAVITTTARAQASLSPTNARSMSASSSVSPAVVSPMTPADAVPLNALSTASPTTGPRSPASTSTASRHLLPPTAQQQQQQQQQLPQPQWCTDLKQDELTQLTQLFDRFQQRAQQRDQAQSAYISQVEEALVASKSAAARLVSKVAALESTLSSRDSEVAQLKTQVGEVTTTHFKLGHRYASLKAHFLTLPNLNDEILRLTRQLHTIEREYKHYREIEIEGPRVGLRAMMQSKIDACQAELSIKDTEIQRLTAELSTRSTVQEAQLHERQNSDRKIIDELKSMLAYQRETSGIKIQAINDKYVTNKKINAALMHRLLELEAQGSHGSFSTNTAGNLPIGFNASRRNSQAPEFDGHSHQPSHASSSATPTLPSSAIVIGPPSTVSNFASAMHARKASGTPNAMFQRNTTPTTVLGAQVQQQQQQQQLQHQQHLQQHHHSQLHHHPQQPSPQHLLNASARTSPYIAGPGPSADSAADVPGNMTSLRMMSVTNSGRQLSGGPSNPATVTPPHVYGPPEKSAAIPIGAPSAAPTNRARSSSRASLFINNDGTSPPSDKRISHAHPIQTLPQPNLHQHSSHAPNVHGGIGGLIPPHVQRQHAAQRKHQHAGKDDEMLSSDDEQIFATRFSPSPAQSNHKRIHSPYG